MLPPLLLMAALACGQTEPAPEQPAPTAPATTSPAPDRWLLMRSLQGTWPGWLLDGDRLQISGWTDAAFTASTDSFSQLPMGFNFRANEFHAILRPELRYDHNSDSFPFEGRRHLFTAAANAILRW
jgi:hypothetical protein